MPRLRLARLGAQLGAVLQPVPEAAAVLASAAVVAAVLRVEALQQRLHRVLDRLQQPMRWLWPGPVLRCPTALSWHCCCLRTSMCGRAGTSLVRASAIKQSNIQPNRSTEPPFRRFSEVFAGHDSNRLENATPRHFIYKDNGTARCRKQHLPHAALRVGQCSTDECMAVATPRHSPAERPAAAPVHPAQLMQASRPATLEGWVRSPPRDPVTAWVPHRARAQT